MANIIIIAFTISYFGFLAWSAYKAWYRTEAFEIQLRRIDKSVDERHIFWYIAIAGVTAFAIWGMVYSWYQV